MVTKHSTDQLQVQKLDTWGQELNSWIIMLHHAVGERMGLSATEHKAADIIRRFGPMTAGKLAGRTGLPTGAVTGLVDRLEKEGFVYREHDKQDRRRVIIKPVEHGRYDEVQKLFGPVHDAMVDLLERYNSAQLETIADFAAKAAEVLKDQTARLRRGAEHRHG